ASTPTVTWPNHTTLVTGDTPARHGVVGNNYLDRATTKPVTLLSDPLFDKDKIVKVPTIYDLAKSARLRTAGIRWPATRNAKNLDWTFPDVATNELLHQYTTPALLAECQKAGVWADGEAQESQSTVRIVSDEMCTNVFNFILHNHRPNFALLHLINVDHIEHASGPKSPEAYAAVKTADQQVRQVWDELQQDFPGKATLVIVSDHGFSRIEHMLMPNVVLQQAGLLEVKGTRFVAGPVRVIIQGGGAMVYVLDNANRAAIVEKIRTAFTGLAGIEKVIGPDQLKNYGVADPSVDPHAPDMILFATEGWAFGDTAAGVMSVYDKPERKGTHGHDPDLPDLHATFVAWGVGIKRGARLGEIQNIDVAPTLAKLLNISMPDVDGKPLTAALAE
ncbi:MAG TPA: ectonucleotide pyrophosphatase/phosphodiesterase, partial [Tepidisphaeraceae bacterium]|nr:ectonucleotide pyrophosphatase/phosphodiesterase [Tepidisphaeraceae bacterium]